LGTAGEPHPIPEDYAPPRISPGGDHITIQAENDAASEIWIHDRVRNVTTRLTTDPAYDYTSAWSPDGTHIVFSSNRDGDYDIFLNERERSREPTLLAATPAREVVNDWSHDGNYIIYRVNREETRADLAYLERSGNDEWKSHAFIHGESAELAGRFSPNGRFVAYQSDESGRWEIYARRFPDGGRKLQISNNGGWNPRWRADGKELFYAEETTLMAVPISTGPELAAGRPRRLFEHAVLGTRLWDVSADGQKFLLAEEASDTPEPEIRVVQNWFEEFRDREQP
jgi:Tol biopolymer transport system component